MQTLCMMIRKSGDRAIVVPRRTSLSGAKDERGLVLSPSIDAVGQRSIEQALLAATTLCGRRLDFRVTFEGDSPVKGTSAGLSLGLMAVAELLELKETPTFFATGAVQNYGGWLAGGNRAQTKARALGLMLGQLQCEGVPQGVPFFTPPLETELGVEGVRPYQVGDLGSAFRIWIPQEYSRIRDRHKTLRRPPQSVNKSALPPRGPFVIVHPDRFNQVREANRFCATSMAEEIGPDVVALGINREITWQAPLPAGPLSPQHFKGLLARAMRLGGEAPSHSPANDPKNP